MVWAHTNRADRPNQRRHASPRRSLGAGRTWPCRRREPRRNTRPRQELGRGPHVGNLKKKSDEPSEKRAGRRSHEGERGRLKGGVRRTSAARRSCGPSSGGSVPRGVRPLERDPHRGKLLLPPPGTGRREQHRPPRLEGGASRSSSRPGDGPTRSVFHSPLIALVFAEMGGRRVVARAPPLPSAPDTLRAVPYSVAGLGETARGGPPGCVRAPTTSCWSSGAESNPFTTRTNAAAPILHPGDGRGSTGDDRSRRRGSRAIGLGGSDPKRTPRSPCSPARRQRAASTARAPAGRGPS